LLRHPVSHVAFHDDAHGVHQAAEEVLRMALPHAVYGQTSRYAEQTDDLPPGDVALEELAAHGAQHVAHGLLARDRDSHLERRQCFKDLHTLKEVSFGAKKVPAGGRDYEEVVGVKKDGRTQEDGETLLASHL